MEGLTLHLGLGLQYPRPLSSGGFGPSPNVPDPDPEAEPYQTADTRVMVRAEGASSWTEYTGTAMTVPNVNRVVHTVHVTGLTPGTTYEFRLPDAFPQAWYIVADTDASHGFYIHWHTFIPLLEGGYDQLPINETVTFKTYTMPATLSGSENIGIISDCHGSGLNLGMFSQVASYDPFLIVYSGDMATGDGGNRPPDTWYVLFEAMKQLVDSQGRLIPQIPNPGNHEAWRGRSGLEHDTNESSGFKPDFEAGERGDMEWYYCFFPSNPGLRGFSVTDCGDYLSVFSIDPGISTRFAGPADDQMAWIVDEGLARNSIPHKLATFHFPMWEPGRRNTATGRRTRHYVGPALMTAGIRAAAQGHDHNAYYTPYIANFEWRDHQRSDIGPVAFGEGIRMFGAGSMSSTRGGRVPATKWWIEESVSYYTYYDFEQADSDVALSNPLHARLELRDPHPDDDLPWPDEDEIRNFWIMNITPSDRSYTGVNRLGVEWASISDPGTDPINVFSTTVLPKLSPIPAGGAIAAALSADYDQISNYASSEGDVVSLDVTLTICRDADMETRAVTVAEMTEPRQAGDILQLTVKVEDDQGNRWTYAWGQEVRE